MDATLLTGYARCSTDEQDLTAQCQALPAMGVPAERIYTDKGLTATNRNRPGLDQALAAVRASDTLVVPKLDRLARSVPDARSIGDALVARAAGSISTITPSGLAARLMVSSATSRCPTAFLREREFGHAMHQIASA